MKYFLLSTIQIFSPGGVASSQDHMVLESQMACKQMQQIMITNPTSSTDTTVVKVTKAFENSQFFVTTQTLICAPQGS